MSDPKRIAVLARRSSVKTVATAFMPAELAVEQAALHGARCITVMIEERKKSQLPPHTGIEQIMLVSEGVTKALESFRYFALAHADLIKIPEEHGMAPAFGPACGPNFAKLGQTEELDRAAA